MVWGGSGSQLYCGDAKTPDIGLEIVPGDLDRLQQHNTGYITTITQQYYNTVMQLNSVTQVT